MSNYKPNTMGFYWYPVKSLVAFNVGIVYDKGNNDIKYINQLFNLEKSVQFLPIRILRIVL